MIKSLMKRPLSLFFLSFSALMLLASVFVAPVSTLIPGFLAIQTSVQAMTMDACAVGGVNGALLNVGLLGLIATAILWHSEQNGLTMGAYFLTVAFAFCGKNCLNIWPIALGVYLYARISKKPFATLAHFALLGAALAPVVSEMLFSARFTLPLYARIPIAVGAGALIGALIPGVSAHTATMHKGYNLYNVGLSAGLMGIVFFGIYRTLAPGEHALNAVYSAGFPGVFLPLFIIAFTVSAVAGFLLCGKSLAPYAEQLKGEDEGFSPGTTLLNFGVLGLLSLGYFAAVGASFTGPTICGLLSLLCWAGMGSNPRTVSPIFAGYALVSLAAPWTLGTQGVCVGISFATGLSPVTARRGYGWGILAGVLHACIAPYTAAMHGGFNIYNGGFGAGLVAMLLCGVFAIIPPRRRAADTGGAEPRPYNDQSPV